MESDLSTIKKEDGSIFQNGVKYVPSKEIAREFDYALSYVAFLARKNKVNATWFGKRWYIDRNSVLKYRKSAKNNKILGGKKSQNNYTQPVLTPVDSNHSFKKSDILRISSLFLLILFFMFGAGIIPISLNTGLLQQDYANFKAIISDRIIGNISLLFNDISNFFSSYANAANTQISGIPDLFFNYFLTVTQAGTDLTSAANTQISGIPDLFFNYFLTVTQAGIDLTHATNARISRVPDSFYNYFLAFTQTGVDLNQAIYNLVLEVKFNSSFLSLSALSTSTFSYFNDVFGNIAFVLTSVAQSLVANIWENIYLPLLPK